MSELDDLLGGGSKTPPNAKFPTPGTAVVIQLTEDPKPLQVREFVKGKPGELRFWQGGKPVNQSDLNLQLPFEKMMQILLVGVTKDGEALSIWADGEKLKALKAANRENPGALKTGALVKMVYTEDDPESKGPFPKKLYAAVIKAPQE